ncbi:type II secretion system F family protein [Desulfovibrio mangrovi]|uniref:type II secretion system F family protein n=1 Tax=Desulfovibrio mangrovi TaxID=2976983 RepID=UPI0022484BCE|nr:type II secretion system F family protein [Desulfovibrio mangrovi]UZP68797.1 type II secretion system F family protein [Desulfovibrio mangrovi]
MISDLPPVVIAASMTMFMFFLVLATIGLISLAHRHSTGITGRVKRLKSQNEYGTNGLLKQDRLAPISWVDALLKQLPPARAIHLLLLQADSPISTWLFLLLSTLLSIVAFVLAVLFVSIPFAPLAIAVATAIFPWLLVRRAKEIRMTKFLEQLPNALDTLARALRAGHALPSGLTLIAEEYDAPLGDEFEKTLQEINFGVSLEKAMTNLMNRVDLPSLRFFAVSIIIQREVGGNLAEIVDTIAHLIREHHKLMGRVRVLSAEARISAIILILIPIAIGGIIQMLNPEYLNLLFEHPRGLFMLKGGIALMIVGVLTIRQMIRIKV